MPQDTAKKVKGLTPEQIAERLDQPGEYPDDIIGPDGIRVPRAAPFRKDTLVVGSTKLARQYEALARLVPSIRGRAKTISAAMPESLIREVADQANNGEDFLDKYTAKNILASGRSNVVGLTNPRTKQMMVQQTGDDREDFDTVAHEMQHLMGLSDPDKYRPDGEGYFRPMGYETAAQTTGKLAGQYYEENKGRLKGLDPAPRKVKK